MPVDSVTVGYLASRVHEIVGNTATVSSNLTSRIKFACNAAMRDLVQKSDHPAFKVQHSFSTVNGTKDYSLPVDFHRLIDPGLRRSTTPFHALALIDQQDHDRLGWAHIYQANGEPEVYHLIGRNASSGQMQLRLYPTPDAAYSLVCPYYANPTDISAAADGTEIDVRFPREYAHAIVFKACLLLPEYLTNQQNQSFQALYLEAMQDMAKGSQPIAGKYRKNQPYVGRMGIPALAYLDTWLGNQISGYSE